MPLSSSSDCERRSGGNAVSSLLMAWMVAATCRAGDLSVTVIDPTGHGVSDVVAVVALSVPAMVTAGPGGPSSGAPATSPAAPATAKALAAAAPATPSVAVMDQRNRTFSPRILVVGVGTQVEFPNNDTVSHQVYSFSPAKKFQLPLYKGQLHPPVIFDRPGLVVLGCNIHDQMVGYIYVTEAPRFGKTDAEGTLRVPGLPAGEYRVTVWSPFIADATPSLTRTVRVAAQEPTSSRIQLVNALRARPEPRPQRADWEY